MPRLVSVVMPVRDAGRWLGEAVDSILSQSHRDLELLVVDDHSRDGAIEALNRRDARLTVLVNEGRGVSSAFNTGLQQAKGEFIARMDGDDVALPNRIESQLGFLERHPDIDICGACVEMFSASGLAGGNRRYQDWLNSCRSPDRIRRELFIESPVPNPTAFFRREALLALGGYADPDWPEDYDLFLRADAAGMRIGKPEGVLLRWRDHDDRLTRTDDRYALRAFQQAKIHYLVRHRLAEPVPLLIWGAGPTGRLTCDLLAAEGREVDGFLEVHPRRIGGEKRGRPVHALDHLGEAGDVFVLVAVGAAGARIKIRDFMNGLGRREGEQYLFVA